MKITQMNVSLVDHMGSDLTVVNAARVSFDKESEWTFVPSGLPTAGEKRLSAADTKLIGYLAKYNHWSPFAHTSIQLRVKAPVFVARQLVKHQVGGVWNEVSRRYVDSEPEFWFPNEWRSRPEGSMKQGSGSERFHDMELELRTCNGVLLDPKLVVDNALFMYEHMIYMGVAPEQARMVLPQNMMTEWYWTGSLMFFVRVCRERLASNAQLETREVAEDIAEVVAPLFPVSWSALMNNQ